MFTGKPARSGKASVQRLVLQRTETPEKMSMFNTLKTHSMLQVTNRSQTALDLQRLNQNKKVC